MRGMEDVPAKRVPEPDLSQLRREKAVELSLVKDHRVVHPGSQGEDSDSAGSLIPSSVIAGLRNSPTRASPRECDYGGAVLVHCAEQPAIVDDEESGDDSG